MLRLHALVLSVTGLAGIGMLRGVPPLRQEPAVPISRVAWMAGCWEQRRGALIVEEQWMLPRGRSMLGMSRTVRADSTTEFETLFLREEAETLVYHATPSGQPPGTFRMIALTDTSVVFQRTEEDFPKRILYRRLSPDSMVARIEGTIEGRPKGLDLPYRRVRCAGS